MIRAAVLLVLCALPANAQDFRGLLPGMPTSDLGRLGEPFDLRNDGGVTHAYYPLPYQRALHVIHTEGMIVFLALGDFTLSQLQPPPTDGLQVGVTPLHEAIALAGSDGFEFAVIPAEPELVPPAWMLSYTMAEHSDLILNLVFRGHLNPGQVAADIQEAADIPQDATLAVATLTDLSILARYSALANLRQPPPPADAVPFALSLADAFPLIEIPQ